MRVGGVSSDFIHRRQQFMLPIAKRNPESTLYAAVSGLEKRGASHLTKRLIT